MTSLLPALAAYIPRDRVTYIMSGGQRPFATNGVAMIADISGFTPLTEALTTGLNAGHGAEELTRALDSVFAPLIEQVHTYRGSVIKFGGDALIVWFGEEAKTNIANRQAQVILRALTAAQNMQQVMVDYGQIPTPIGPVRLKMKIGLTYGAVKRFNLGLPEYGYEDIIAGDTLDRMADAEHHAEPGDIITDKATWEAVEAIVPATEWRDDFAVIDEIAQVAPPAPWPELVCPPEQEEDIVKALATYVPRPVYETLLAKQARVAELKPVVSLFVQFHGLDYDADPDVAEKLQTYFVTAQRIVARFNGRLNRLITGDKGSLLHIIFGAPRTVEEQETRAVHCGLDLQAECGQLPFITMRRIGITVGRCFAGPVGGPVRHDYTTMGDSINLSARLMQNAADDQILLEKAVREQLDEQFEIADLGTIVVKGKSQPIPIFSALAVHSARYRQQNKSSERMFGRDKETAVIQQQIAMLTEGKGGVISIVGEVGMGKTLLLDTLRHESQTDQSATILWSNAICLAYGQMISGYLLIDLIRDLLALPSDAGPDQTSQYLLDFCEALFGAERLDATYPYLAAFMGLPLSGDFARRLEGLSGESVRWQLLTMLPELFRHLAQKQPVVLALDDVQWADPTSRQLLTAILPVTADVPLLILLAMRPGEEDFEGTVVRHLKLGALETAVAENLVRHHAPDWPEQVMAKLVERSGGNPLFLMEMVRTLHLQDTMDDTVDFETLSLPTTIDGLILARFDRLTVEARHTLQVASVIGQTFLDKVLTAVAAAEEKIENQLTELVHQDYIQLADLDLGEAHAFRHQLIQESAYSTLLYERRREYHQVVAETLEYFFPSEIMEQASLLAYHYEHAADLDKAIAYHLQGADQSRLLYAHEEADNLYQKVLALLEKLPEPDLQQKMQTYLKLAQVRANDLDFSGAQAYYEQAFTLQEILSSDRVELLQNAVPFKWGILPEYTHSFDPGLVESVETWQIIANLFEGLVELDNDWNIRPALARSWELLDDGFRYRFHLHADLFWSDGQPLTAHDFVFAWQRNLRLQAPLSYQLHIVEGATAVQQKGGKEELLNIQAVDDLTLEVVLTSPMPYFIYLLAFPITFPQPQHVVQELGDQWAFPQNVVGNGPFIVDQVAPDQTIQLTRNSHYNGRYAGNLATVTLNPLEPTLAHYQQGLIDWCRIDNDAQIVKEDKVSNSYLIQDFVTFILGFACNNPPFDNKLVRQAFVHCIDREALVEQVWGNVQKPAAGGFISSGLPGHSPEMGLPFNPQQARKLLADAGYVGKNAPKSIRLITLPGFEQTPHFLQAAWQKWLDITVDIVDDISLDELDPDLTAGQAHMILLSHHTTYPDPDDILRSDFHRDSSGNFFGWRNKKFDNLIDLATTTIDSRDRFELYHQADEVLVRDDAVIAPLYYFRAYGLLQSSFKLTVEGNLLKTNLIKFKDVRQS